jgi:hypothetical protein
MVIRTGISKRFYNIPRVFDGCVYAAELKNGMVKVGFSKNPRTRIHSLLNQVKRKYNADLRNYHVSPNLTVKQARIAELALIKAANRINLKAVA